jgi:carotenoid phi-ring synthase / carotenoid chi-ring synthase
MMERAIMARLGGPRRIINTVREDLPTRIGGSKTVAVIGAGIAGLTAAALLAERGFRVTLMEKNAHIGGKAGSWKATLDDGFEAQVDHGFHGFFRQYFNLRRLMDRFGAAGRLVPMDDYVIWTTEHGNFSFKGIRTTPLLNMLSLSGTGLYRMRDMLVNPGARHLLAFLRYDGEKTFTRWDGVSFRDFSAAARIPPAMRIMFNTFSRSFFADPELMSTAEVIKSFHFYFLSNDLGLIYDYLDGDYEETLLGPARAWLEKHGASVLTSRPVRRIHTRPHGLSVDGLDVDYVVCAADAGSTRRIVEDSGLIEEDPAAYGGFARLRSSQGYAVARLWLDRPVDRKVPPFLATDRLRMLDSITLFHRIDRASAKWAERNGGSVVELHSYALPMQRRGDAAVREGLLDEAKRYLPELRGARVVHQHLQVRDDFTAFHVGMHADRPGTRAASGNLLFAGDWVKIRPPAMLMEAACASAVLAVNEILRTEGVREEPVLSVAEKGVLA